MDRTFNFFDHPTLTRQTTPGNNAQSSPSLIPQNVFQAQQQHAASHGKERHYQHQHSSRIPHSQSQTHLQQAIHHQYPHNRHVSHHFREEPDRLHQEANRQHPHNIQPFQTQQPSLSQQQQLGQHLQSQSQEHVVTSQIQQQLQLHPVGSHLHDSVVSAAGGGISHNSSSHLIHSHHRPGNQRQFNHHPNHIRQGQIGGQHQAHHSPQFSVVNQLSSTTSNPMSSMNLSQSPAQLGASALAIGPNSATFTATAALSHTTSHLGQAVSHDTHQHQHPSQIHIQSQGSLPNQTLANAPNSSNTFAGQPLQVHAMISQQGSNTASFGSLGNMQNSVLPGSTVEDPSGSVNQFVSQSGDSVSALNPWESAHPHVPLGSQRMTSQIQQQNLLPPPVGGDSRTISGSNVQQNQSFGTHPGSGQSNFGSTFSGGLSALGTSIHNTTEISGLAQMAGHVGQNVSGLEKDLLKPPLTSFSLQEGESRTGKPIKKAKTLMGRKSLISKTSGSRATQPTRGPITSPVSTATLPNLKKHVAVKRVPNCHQNQACKANRDSKVREHECSNALHEEMSHPAGLPSSTAIASGNSPIPRTCITQTMDRVTAANTHNTNERDHSATVKATNVFTGWPAKKSNMQKNRKCPRNLDGRSTVTVPVHLRNPKKGRARVFRECQQCRSENHIRRSDCIVCKEPLPAGKRRRDGNPSYSRKPSSSSLIPSSEAGPRVDSSQGIQKEDAAVSSVTGK